MRKPPAAKPSSTISASVKTARRRAMRASSTDGRAAASPSAKSSAARSRGVSAPVPASLGSSSSYSPSALSEGSRTLRQRSHSLRSAIQPAGPYVQVM